MDCDELISKGALIDQLELLAAHEDDWRQSCILGIVRTIDKAPAVDAVEVVRCRECVYADTTSCILCYIEKQTLTFINHDPDFFCGYGERKQGDADG